MQNKYLHIEFRHSKPDHNLEVYMSISAVDSISGDREEFTTKEGSLNGCKVCVLDGSNGIPSVQLETRQNEGFSLSNRNLAIKPMMSKISEINLEYTRTNSDGSANTIKVGLEFKGDDKDTENSSPSDNNNYNDTGASDIDSRDRGSDNDHDN